MTYNFLDSGEGRSFFENCLYKIIEISSFCINDDPMGRIEDKTSNPHFLGYFVNKRPEADSLDHSSDDDFFSA